MTSEKPAHLSNPPSSPVSRLSPPDTTHLPPSARLILDEEAQRFGTPLNTTTVLAHHPALLEACKAWYAAMTAAGTLIPATLKYLIYVRVASLNGCPF